VDQKQFDFLYNKAKTLMKESKDSVHNWAHVKRVIENISKIKKLLPLIEQEKLDDKILTIAAAWHDISYVFFKPGIVQLFWESRRSRKIAEKYFKKARLSQKERELLTSIILYHSFATKGMLNKKRSRYHQIVQDADTLDNLYKGRIKQAKRMAGNSNSGYYKFIAKIIYPLFYNLFSKNIKLFLNLKQSSYIRFDL